MSQPVTEEVAVQAPTHDRVADRIGVGASVLCAVHCAITPVLLLLLPAFGEVWSHPATHWGMALLVVPLAGLMMKNSYQRHHRKWILAAGSVGIVFILSGAAAPYLEAAPAAVSSAGRSKVAKGIEGDGQTVCTDSCCPSVQETDAGGWEIHIPTASILTTLGGAFLIVTHVGNLRLCHCVTCHPSE